MQEEISTEMNDLMIDNRLSSIYPSAVKEARIAHGKTSPNQNKAMKTFHPTPEVPVSPREPKESLKSVNELLTDRVREAIFSGELAEGEFLRQQALAQRYGVSGVVVREALRRLEAEGLVETKRRKGARVAPLSVEEITELYDLRILLEELVTRYAVPNTGLYDLARAEAIHEVMTRERDPIRWLALNREFHTALLLPSNKLRLLKFVNDLRGMVERYLRMSLTVLQGFEVAQREHEAILVAYRAREAEEAAKLVGAHLRRTANTIADFLITHMRNSEASRVKESQ